MNHDNVVWSHSTTEFDIWCLCGNVGFSDLVNDNECLQRSVESGLSDVVRLVAEVSSKGELLLGRASRDALMRPERHELIDTSIDVFMLDHEDVRRVVEAALSEVADNLASVDDPRSEGARKLRDQIHQFIPGKL